jgi:hypothetical protein
MPPVCVTKAMAPLIALGALALGCSSFDGGSDMLVTGALEPASPGAPSSDSAWSCLGPSRITAPPAMAAQGRVLYSMQLVDITTRRLALEVRTRACTIADVECADPVTPWLTPDDQGWVDLTLFEGFVGYFEVDAEGLVPGLIFPGETINVSTTLNYPVFVLTASSFVALAGSIGLAQDPALGAIAIRSFNCEGVTASDVALSTAAAGDGWYFADGLPSATATKTGSEGYGGFINVPPGVVAVDALAPTGSSVSGERTLVVRTGWFSLLYLWPLGAQIAPPEAPSRGATAPR